jgi:hypothetical protein
MADMSNGLKRVDDHCLLAIILVLGSKAFGSASYTRCARTQQRKDFDFNQQVKRAGEVLPSAAEIYP